MTNKVRNLARLLDSVNKKLSPEQDFIGDLKRSIELTDKKNARKPSQTYKPSSMKCIRNMYYQVTGTEPDDGETGYCLIGICNSGTDIHVRIQTAVSEMKNNGIDCEYVDVAQYVRDRNLTDQLDIISQEGMETKLYNKILNISFLCDGIIRYKGHYYVLELKTENSYKFSMRKDVDESHYEQGTAYSYMLNLPEVIFVYICRDNLEMRSFMFKPTDEMKQDLLCKILDCDGYKARNEVPPKPTNISKKQCTYCGYRKTCENDN